MLPPAVDRVRRLLADLCSLPVRRLLRLEELALLLEAWDEGQTTPSAWGRRCGSRMAAWRSGMALLAVQLLLQVLGSRHADATPAHLALDCMGVGTIGLLYGGATLVALFSGIPIAFALGGVATVFMMLFMPAASLDTVAQNVYEELASITLLTIPLFILKGAAIGKSRAGKDLYDALHTWLHRVPGGLGVAVVIACGLFAAMAGSSPATCSAIGSSGIPEMRRRGYSPGFAAGLVAAGGTLGILLPPSIVLILYAVASEQSLGRLFLAGIGPGVLLVVLFAG